MAMSDNGSLDIVEQFNFKKKELGVVLALAEKGPSVVSKLLAQLGESGEQDVVMWYEQAKAALDSVPKPASVSYHLSKPKSAPFAA
jgi:hypothetical protein